MRFLAGERPQTRNTSKRADNIVRAVLTADIIVRIVPLMKREAFLSALRAYCKASGLAFGWDKKHGKGSHGKVFVGDRATTVKYGEITPGMKKIMLKQLGLPPDAF